MAEVNPFADMPAPSPSTGASANPFADMPGPDFRNTPVGQNIASGAALGARSGIRALLSPLDLISSFGPGLDRANADQVAAETGGNYTGDPVKATQTTDAPSEQVIKMIGQAHGAPLELGPDASPAMQKADQIAPWLWPTGNQISRVGEAPGLFNKATTFGRSEVGALTDWFLSDAGQQWAREHNLGPVAETILGITGASLRHGLSSGVAPVVRNLTERPDGESGVNYDRNKAIGVTAPLKSVADPDSSFGKLSSGVSAFPFSGTGEKGALDAQEAAIKGTANEALQQFAPGSTPVEEAGPSSLNDFSTDLGNQGRSKILNDELELKTRSDQVEAAIDPNRRVDATPVLDAALELATNKDNAGPVQDAAVNAYKQLQRSVGPDGKISFNALKTNRSAFGAIVDNMFQPSSGARGAKDTVAKNISSIEDAMSAQMQQAANDAGQGPAWSQLDQGWKSHGQVKRSLAPTAGVLDDANAQQPWETYAPADKITSSLQSAVRGGDMPVIENISALGRETANKAVAETIAAKGQPAHPKSREAFRPDVFGEQGDAAVNQNVKSYMGEQAPGSDVKLQQAIDAAKTTAEPQERGGLRRLLGSIGAGGAALMGSQGLLGAGGAAALPLTTLLTSALHDPSFIRTVSNRRFTADNIAGLLTQYASRAGLGSRPDPLDPGQTVRDVGGQAAKLASQVVPNVTHELMKYFSGVGR